MLRRDPPGHVIESSRADEFAILEPKDTAGRDIDDVGRASLQLLDRARAGNLFTARHRSGYARAGRDESTAAQ